jgi:hypothetical protein
LNLLTLPKHAEVTLSTLNVAAVRTIFRPFGSFTLAWTFFATLCVANGQAFLTNGLIAYYPFNGNANDASGNGHNGTPTNAILTTDRFGQSNAAFAFNGTTSVIGVPHSTVLNLTNTDFTISLWAALNAPQSVSPQFYLISKDDGISKKWIFGHGGTAQYPSFRNLYFLRSGPGAGDVWYGDGKAYTVKSNEWHQYIVRKAGSTYNTYVDGLLFSSETNLIESLSGNAAPVTIGRAENLSVNGKLDDLRIYSRALSTNELTSLFRYETAFPPEIAGTTRALGLQLGNLVTGAYYQIQTSSDMSTWTNYGVAFLATSAFSVQYVDVGWSNAFFRVQRL